jgi:hypothetical protein
MKIIIKFRTKSLLKDSSYYQVLLKEDIEAGLRKGDVKGTRKLLIRLGRVLFGRLQKASRTTIEAIDDLDQLELLSKRILTAPSWADLLGETK